VKVDSGSDLVLIDLLGRAADASLRGYVYQVFYTLKNWLLLEADQVLVCEGIEDLDLADGRTKANEHLQIKHLAASVSARSKPVYESIVHFADGFVALRKQGLTAHAFKFVTTAAVARERLGVSEEDILALWDRLRQGGGTGEQDDRVAELAAELQGRFTRTTLQRRSVKASIQRSWATASRYLSDEGLWPEFVRSVQWQMDAPPLESLGSEIRAMVAADSRTKELEVATLTDRLVVEVLRRCIASTPAERILRPSDLDRIVRTTNAQLEEWAKNTEYNWALRFFRLNELLTTGQDRAPDTAAPALLLNPSYQLVPYFDFHGQLAEVSKLCLAGSSHALVIHGEAGVGKTRFAIEVCAQLRTHGWAAGLFANGSQLDQLEFAVRTATSNFCVVLDEADSNLPVAERLLDLVGTHGAGERKAVMLLLARYDAFADELRPRTSEGIALRHALRSVQLPLLPQSDSVRQGFLATATAAFGPELRRRHVASTSVVEPPRTRNPLVFAASVLAASAGRHLATEADILDALIDREETGWLAAVSSDMGLVQPGVRRALRRAIVGVSLIAPLRIDMARGLMEKLAGPSVTPAQVAVLADMLIERYTPVVVRRSGHVLALQPDLIAEHAGGRAVREDAEFVGSILSSFVTEPDAVRHVVGKLLAASVRSPATQLAVQAALENWAANELEPAHAVGLVRNWPEFSTVLSAFLAEISRKGAAHLGPNPERTIPNARILQSAAFRLRNGGADVAEHVPIASLAAEIARTVPPEQVFEKGEFALVLNGLADSLLRALDYAGALQAAEDALRSCPHDGNERERGQRAAAFTNIAVARLGSARTKRYADAAELHAECEAIDAAFRASMTAYDELANDADLDPRRGQFWWSQGFRTLQGWALFHHETGGVPRGLLRLIVRRIRVAMHRLELGDRNEHAIDVAAGHVLHFVMVAVQLGWPRQSAVDVLKRVLRGLAERFPLPPNYAAMVEKVLRR
jgi:hypothetical protein